jgi:6-pyruvoyltetrahydropterin/6-carboxytetrahydropterin synthase
MNVYSITKEFRFEAAHVLPSHSGKCGRLHGHSWKAAVTLKGYFLQHAGSSVGMLADFADVKAIVQPIVDGALDHHLLNETTGLKDPTSENLARWLFEAIDQRITADYPALVGYLESVRIDETCTSSCTYAVKA